METKPETHSPGRAGPGYETRDTSIRGLVIFGITLFVSLVVVLVVAAKLFQYFATVQSLGPPASPFANARVLPPAPRLQVGPHLDLQHYQQSQQELLNSYGWVDRNAGTVRIPIDRAMDLLLQQGLPARSTAGNQERPSGKQHAS
jgi:hypothetical protein